MLQDRLTVSVEEADPKGEAGQAMVEYVILVGVIAAFLTTLHMTYTAAVRSYFAYIAYVWMTPVT
jgi:Flp pilus assembly pilin Flp